jgi:hypothetical protein
MADLSSPATIQNLNLGAGTRCSAEPGDIWGYVRQLGIVRTVRVAERRATSYFRAEREI